MGPKVSRRWIAAGLSVGMVLVGMAGAQGARAHPGNDEHEAPGGIGVQVNSPDALVAFHEAVQWGDTGELDDQTADLVYAGTGCSPVNYIPIAAEIQGNIALVDANTNPANPADVCPAATFFQKVRSAQEAGAIGFVQVPGLDAEGNPNSPTPNATAVDASIPALEVFRTDAVVEMRDAVIAGETVNVTLADTFEVIELNERLSDIPCVDGKADVFDCEGIDLLSFVPAAEFDGIGQSDIWGWTDPETGDEYVMMGKTDGTAMFRVTDPTNPVYLGALPNPAILQEIWHDIKVYANHMFVVSESQPHGMLVFDLTRLRGVDEPQEWDADAQYPLSVAAHNVAINTDTGFAYIVGGNAAIVLPDHCLSGLHMVDINTPTQPTFAGCYLEEGGPGTLGRTIGEPVESISPLAYVHDTECVIYDGPDTRYSGQELCFNAAETGLVIADVTNKLFPTTVGSTDYPTVGYAHQGSLTEDHRFVIFNDELDEVTEDNGVDNTRTIVLDVTDLENPTVHFIHEHETTSIDHNNYVVDGLVYQSNYTSGLRVLDTAFIDDADNPRLEPLAFFDTYPTHSEPTFNGTWSNYPYFDSGTIAVSGIDEGLFLLRLQDEDVDVEPEAGVEFDCVDCSVSIRAGDSGTAQLEVTNTGTDDDTYDLSVADVPDRWTATVDPAQLPVSPGETATATLTIDVHNSGRPNPATIGVTATSALDEEVSASTDITVEVTRGPPMRAQPTGDIQPETADGSNDRSLSTTEASSSRVRLFPVTVAVALALAGMAAWPLRRRFSAGE